jgi:hypothetical protein
MKSVLGRLQFLFLIALGAYFFFGTEAKADSVNLDQVQTQIYSALTNTHATTDLDIAVHADGSQKWIPLSFVIPFEVSEVIAPDLVNEYLQSKLTIVSVRRLHINTGLSPPFKSFLA